MSERICPICGKPLPKDAYRTAIYCSDACRKTKKRQIEQARHEYLKQHGICVKCGQSDAKKGHLHCQQCINNVSIDGSIRRERRIAKKLCARCGTKIDSGILCNACNEKKLANDHRKYQFCISNGICTICKRRKTMDGQRTCPVCQEKARQRNARKKAA